MQKTFNTFLHLPVIPVTQGANKNKIILGKCSAGVETFIRSLKSLKINLVYILPLVDPLVHLATTKIWITYIQAYMPNESKCLNV